MLDAVTLNRELPKLGYQHHVFVSYARARLATPVNPGGTRRADPFRKRAQLLKGILEEELAKTFNTPSVFTDSDIANAADWEGALAGALYSSVVVIAVCDPVYFTRGWCAREWYGAEAEHKRRPMDGGRGVLIYGTTAQPGSSIYPRWANALQGADLSAMGASGFSRRSRSVINWLQGIREHVEIVASHWITNRVSVQPQPALPDRDWPSATDPTPTYPLTKAA